MTRKLNVTASSLAFAALRTMTALCPAGAQAEDSGMASTAVGVEVKLLSDLRSRGVSDSGRKPAAQLSLQLAHESGIVGLAQLSTVSKKTFANGDGVNLLLAAGYRFGDPEGWHYGVGLASEFYPGASFVAPHRINPATGEASDFRRTRYNTSYAMVDIGWGGLEGRIMTVISGNLRGANTGGVCGQTLVAAANPTAGLACYARGDHDSRGTMLYDIGYRYDLTPTTTIKLHAGTQIVRHFKEANLTDYSIGIVHQRWGFEWSAEWMGTKVRQAEVFKIADGNGWKAQNDRRLVFTVSRKF